MEWNIQIIAFTSSDTVNTILCDDYMQICSTQQQLKNETKLYALYLSTFLIQTKMLRRGSINKPPQQVCQA